MKGDVSLRYIGSKQLLLKNIDSLLRKHVTGEEETFLDLFAGTNSVGLYFKNRYTIYSNDLLYFSYVHAKAVIENNKELSFSTLKENGIKNPFVYLQNDDNINTNQTRYYQEAYTPLGNTMYLSVENGKKIDFIRDKLEEWKKNNWIADEEYYYLLSSLIEAIPYVSNITGTYGAFLKHWDKRALKTLELVPLEVKNNKRKNIAFNKDANELVKEISADIVYIDTPYNTRQYASNYHLLENVATNQQPTLKGKTKIFDWSNLRSDYATKRNALGAMESLIKNIDATHIILSYNTEGIISENDLISLLSQYAVNNNIEIKRIPYRKYKSKVPSKKNNLCELLIYLQRKPLKTKGAKAKTVTKKIEKKTWQPQTQKYLKSPLNYIGGKYKLLNQIIPLFPNDIDTFVDLFSGGANVGINVTANRHIFNDMNNKINEMFRYFNEHSADELILKIKNRINQYELSKTNESAYLKFRRDYNENPNPLDLYVLVSYSYNYQFRFNNSMEFNNPFGRNRSQFSENMEKNLRLFVDKLSSMNAIFTDSLFTDLNLDFLSQKDFVYLDPPYLITTGNYNDGNRGFVNWGESQENAMYNLMDNLTEKGVRYALSNVLTHKGRTNTLLKNYISSHNVHTNYLDYHYNNSSYNTTGSGSTEVLITNYDPTSYQVPNSLVLSELVIR